MIIIDATGATSGIDFEAFIRGGFVADQEGGGAPSWDNSNAFSGEELFFSYGTEATSKYVFGHGEAITYDGFPPQTATHTVHGLVEAIEFGTRGTGSFDSDGHFTGGNVELRISGLDLSNLVGDRGGVVNAFALAFMGMGGQPSFDAYADALDGDAQTFRGSDFADIYSGTDFGDYLKGRGGDDQLDGGAGADWFKGGLGADILTGGGGIDTFVFVTAKQSSAKGGIDTITDFAPGEDLIDLSGLNKSVDFIGDDKFSGDREVRYIQKQEKTVVIVDKNGDGSADMKIKIAAVIDLGESDFVL
jgi:Ca2+-binding RTX toxin-like protein